jgi:hypothetical protein
VVGAFGALVEAFEAVAGVFEAVVRAFEAVVRAFEVAFVASVNVFLPKLAAKVSSLCCFRVRLGFLTRPKIGLA